MVPSEIREDRGVVRYFRVLGPGLVTGAADGDPSGITAYSAAGASLGHSMLRMAWVTYPLMAAIQLVAFVAGMAFDLFRAQSPALDEGPLAAPTARS